TGDILKTCLPQHGIVEQALHEDHFRISSRVRPKVQAAFGARQKAVRGRRRRNAAAIEIAFQRKDNPAHVWVVDGCSPHATSRPRAASSPWKSATATEVVRNFPRVPGV